LQGIFLRTVGCGVLALAGTSGSGEHFRLVVQGRIKSLSGQAIWQPSKFLSALNLLQFNSYAKFEADAELPPDPSAGEALHAVCTERPESRGIESRALAAQEQQNRYRQRLEDAAALTGRVAHAFDNVLTGIVGFAELTLSQTPSDSAPHQYVAEVLRAAQGGVQLTQQLHLFSRCASTGVGPTSLPLLAADEEARLVQMVGPQVRVQFNVPRDLAPVSMDAEPLRQLIVHLLQNARESLGAGGTISLTARPYDLPAAERLEWQGNPEPGPALEIVVADSGSGVSAEARQRLFVEPFFSTKPRHRGIGLAIVCRTVFSHGGGFRLEPAPGSGTLARTLLPVAGSRK
jgi:signal transduction histidine kinase